MDLSDKKLTREVELKYRLKKESAFLKFKAQAFECGDINNIRELSQTNYFFDTPNFSMRAHSLAVRLRQENERFLLCIKGNDPESKISKSSLSIKLEYEKEVSREMASNWLEGKDPVHEFLRQVDEKDDIKKKTKEYLCAQIAEFLQDENLSLVGSFENKRTCVPVIIAEQKLVLELDETHFSPEDIHFEVELEIPETFDYKIAQEFLVEMSHAAQVKLSSSSGKAERFHAILTGRKKRNFL